MSNPSNYDVSTAIAILGQLIQDDGVRIGLTALTAIVLALIFEKYAPAIFYATAAPAAKAVIEYIKFDIYERAKYRFESQGLKWLGFRHDTAVVSGICAVSVYFVVKTSIGFLQYWHMFLAVLLTVIVIFSICGYVVSGPGLDLTKRFGKTCRHFFAPTINGLIIFSLDGVVSLAKLGLGKWLL